MQKNPYPSLLNRYTGSLFAVMTVSLLYGAWMLYNLDLRGFILFLPGCLMLLGFKQPGDAKPRKVWIITFLGQMTETVADKLTLLLDWLPIEFVGHVEVVVKQEDRDFPLKKAVRCKDGQYIFGLVSTSVIPDEHDDPVGLRDSRGEWKSGGRKLREFAEMGEMKDIFNQLDDILTAWLQIYANLNTSEQMEIYSHEIEVDMLQCVTGMKGRSAEAGNSTLDDTRGFGIKFMKFQLILKADDEVIKKRNEIQMEIEKSKAEAVNAEAMNQQIALRLKMYYLGVMDASGQYIVGPTPRHLIPQIHEIRNQILQENLERAGKLSQVINSGGLNVVNLPNP